MPFTIFASFAVALSTDLYSLLFWRFVQTFGCSGSFALGAATIGDIYKVEERGSAMGTFLGVSFLVIVPSIVMRTFVYQAMLFGLAMAPPMGGKSSCRCP